MVKAQRRIAYEALAQGARRIEYETTPASTAFKRSDLKVRLNVQQIKRNEKRTFLHYCNVGDVLA